MTSMPAETPWVDQFLADIASESSEIVITIKGHSLRFNVLTDAVELGRIKAKARELVAFLGKKQSGPFEGLTPVDPETAGRVAMLSELSIEPKLSHVDILKIARREALFFDSVIAALDRASEVDMQVEQVKRINEAKNESSGTSSGETA